MGFLPREIHNFLVENGELILGFLIIGVIGFILYYLATLLEDFK
tara:strand:- start:205 stop:336 length:132 start_codon:yes stop_codon:yes gene_type:complete